MPTSIELIERIYEASANGDLDALVGMAATDLLIQQDPALPWGGRYEGPNGVVEFFQRLAGTVDTDVTTEALFAAGDQVIQYGRSRGYRAKQRRHLRHPRVPRLDRRRRKRHRRPLLHRHRVDARGARPMSVPTSATVTEQCAAAATDLYDLIADITNMGRWSPECRSCGWLDSPRSRGLALPGPQPERTLPLDDRSPCTDRRPRPRVHLCDPPQGRDRHPMDLPVRRWEPDHSERVVRGDSHAPSHCVRRAVPHPQPSTGVRRRHARHAGRPQSRRRGRAAVRR